eukprot:1918006-Prymnesium_polylepis.1
MASGRCTPPPSPRSRARTRAEPSPAAEEGVARESSELITEANQRGRVLRENQRDGSKPSSIFR